MKTPASFSARWRISRGPAWTTSKRRSAKPARDPGDLRRQDRLLRIHQIDGHRAAREPLVVVEQLPALDHLRAVRDPGPDVRVLEGVEDERDLAAGGRGVRGGSRRPDRGLVRRPGPRPAQSPGRRGRRLSSGRTGSGRSWRARTALGLDRGRRLDRAPQVALLLPLVHEVPGEDEHRECEGEDVVSIHDGASTEPGRSRPRGRDGSAAAAGHREATRASRRGERWLPR